MSVKFKRSSLSDSIGEMCTKSELAIMAGIRIMNNILSRRCGTALLLGGQLIRNCG